MPNIVYEAVNKISGGAYIGITCKGLRRRQYQHEKAAEVGRPGKFYTALRKYGPTAFAWREIAALPTYAEAEIAECLAIAVRRPRYNVARGGSKGNLGGVASAETREKMRKAKTGKVKSAETRAKISDALRASSTYEFRAERTKALHCGLKRSAETCARISASRKGKPLTPAQIAANTARRGTHPSEATRQRMSASSKKSEAAKAHRRRLVALHTGREASAETCAKLSKALKAHHAKARNA